MRWIESKYGLTESNIGELCYVFPKEIIVIIV